MNPCMTTASPSVRLTPRTHYVSSTSSWPPKASLSPSAMTRLLPTPRTPSSCWSSTRRAGRSWVTVVGDEVVGYILVGVLDDAAHIFHVCVHPDYQGQRLGKALIEQVKDWARSTGRPAVTLATFYEVPWNGRLYEHLGFRVLDERGVGTRDAGQRGARLGKRTVAHGPGGHAARPRHLIQVDGAGSRTLDMADRPQPPDIGWPGPA